MRAFPAENVVPPQEEPSSQTEPTRMARAVNMIRMCARSDLPVHENVIYLFHLFRSLGGHEVVQVVAEARASLTPKVMAALEDICSRHPSLTAGDRALMRRLSSASSEEVSTPRPSRTRA